MSVVLNTKHLSGFINEEEYKAIYPQVEAAHKQLEAKNGPGNDFLGWMYLPRDYDKEEFARIKEAAKKIREDSEVLVVAGIGGSYLGARAVIEAVKGLYHNEIENGLKIYFCGNSISPTYLNDIIALCKGKKFSINVISKSGTTTETSLAFRVLRKLLEDEVGVEEANQRIYATTDRAKGTLKQLADAQGWPTFVVPDDVRRRPLLRALRRGSAAHRRCRHRHRRADEGRSRRHGALLRPERGQRRLQVRRHPQHPVPQGQGGGDPRMLRAEPHPDERVV